MGDVEDVQGLDDVFAECLHPVPAVLLLFLFLALETAGVDGAGNVGGRARDLS